MVPCAAPEGVYTQRPVLLLGMSILQGPTLKRPVLLLDVSTLPCTWNVSTPQRPELHLDLSTLQPALLLEVFTLQRP